jgi:hypothetical protein
MKDFETQVEMQHAILLNGDNNRDINLKWDE